MGYPRLAAFLSSEQSFGVYRGYSYLHARVLLRLQDQIAVLERELDNKDKMDVHNGLQNHLKCRGRDERESGSEGRTRKNILDDIQIKLGEYGVLLLWSLLTHVDH